MPGPCDHLTGAAKARCIQANLNPQQRAAVQQRASQRRRQRQASPAPRNASLPRRDPGSGRPVDPDATTVERIARGAVAGTHNLASGAVEVVAQGLNAVGADGLGSRLERTADRLTDTAGNVPIAQQDVDARAARQRAMDALADAPDRTGPRLPFGVPGQAVMAPQMAPGSAPQTPRQLAGTAQAIAADPLGQMGALGVTAVESAPHSLATLGAAAVNPYAGLAVSGILETGAQLQDAAHAPDGSRRDVTARAGLAAVISGVASAGFDTVSNRLLLGRVNRSMMAAGIAPEARRSALMEIRNGVTGLARKVGQQAGTEGGTEALQTVIQNAGARYGWDASRELGEGVVEAALVGAISGGGMQVGGSTLVGASGVAGQIATPGGLPSSTDLRQAFADGTRTTAQAANPPAAPGAQAVGADGRPQARGVAGASPGEAELGGTAGNVPGVTQQSMADRIAAEALFAESDAERVAFGEDFKRLTGRDLTADESEAAAARILGDAAPSSPDDAAGETARAPAAATAPDDGAVQPGGVLPADGGAAVELDASAPVRTGTEGAPEAQADDGALDGDAAGAPTGAATTASVATLPERAEGQSVRDYAEANGQALSEAAQREEADLLDPADYADETGAYDVDAYEADLIGAVAERGTNPVLIAETWEKARGREAREADPNTAQNPVEAAIADNLGWISTAETAEITDLSPSQRLAYFRSGKHGSKRGRVRSMAERAEEVSDASGVEVTADDVRAFIIAYPNGARSYMSQHREPRRALEQRMRSVTGEPVSAKRMQAIREAAGMEEARAVEARTEMQSTDPSADNYVPFQRVATSDTAGEASVAAVEAVVDAEGFAGWVRERVTVAATPEALPEGAREAYARGMEAGLTQPGMFYDGRVYLVAEALAQAAETRGLTVEQMVRQTVLHEVVAHQGLRVALGADFDAAMQGVARAADEDTLRRIARLYDDQMTGQAQDPATWTDADRVLVAEEWLAKVAEGMETTDPGVMARVWEALRSAARRVFGAQMDERDAMVMLYAASDYLRGRQGTAGALGPRFMLVAYHGTPWTFERFSTDKIGTGEGVQAYGWGLYFTDLEAIARNYANDVARQRAEPSRVGEVWPVAWAREHGGGREAYARYVVRRLEAAARSGEASAFAAEKAEVLADLEAQVASKQKNLGWVKNREGPYGLPGMTAERLGGYEAKAADGVAEAEALARATRALVAENFGPGLPRNVYRVSLHGGKNPGEYDYLDWRAPVPSDMLARVREAVDAAGGDIKEAVDGYFKPLAEGITGQMLYSNLTAAFDSDKAASEFLLAAGIDGIRFEANQGRADGYNYVVFDDSEVQIDEVTRFSRTPEASGELLAPNGKPSNLNAVQHAQVRTPEFKAWFGDWENDPENASKVVDSNGEPMVMYHGTLADVEAFDLGASGSATLGPETDGVIYLTSEASVADEFSGYQWRRDAEGTGTEKVFLSGANTMALFVNLRNPGIWRMGGAAYDAEEVGAMIQDARREGEDGLALLGIRDGNVQTLGRWPISNQALVFDPTQIKSATGNSGAFSSTNPDIRFSREASGELLAPNGKPSNLNAVQHAQVRTPEFKAWFGDWENDPENASKVVDSNGEPLVVYHGTGADFDVFDDGRFGEKTGDDLAPLGHYFSSSREAADVYAYGDSPSVGEYFLNIRSVYDIDLGSLFEWDDWAGGVVISQSADEIKADADNYGDDGFRLTADDDAVESLGLGPVESETQWVARTGAQIRRTNPDIRFSRQASGETGGDSLTDLVARLRQRQEQKQAEQAAREAAGAEIDRPTPGARGLNKAAVTEARKNLGLAAMAEPKARRWSALLQAAQHSETDENGWPTPTLIDMADAAALAVEANPDAIPTAKDLGITLPDNVTVTGDLLHAAFVVRAAELTDAHESDMARADEMNAEGLFETARVYRARAWAKLEALDRIQNASTLRRREASREMRAGGMGLAEDSFSLTQVLLTAKRDKGSALTEGERKTLEDTVRKLRKVEAELAQMEGAAVVRKKRRATSVIRDGWPKTALTEARRVEIRRDREDIKRKIRGLFGRANDAVGVSAEYLYLLGKLALSHAKEQKLNLEEIIALVREDVPEATDAHVIEALATPKIPPGAKGSKQNPYTDTELRRKRLEAKRAQVAVRTAQRALKADGGDSLFTDVVNLNRTLVATGDVSALGNQAGPVIRKHPIHAARSFMDSLLNLREADAVEVDRQIRADPRFDTMEQAKLFFGPVGPGVELITLEKREEQYKSRFIQRLGGPKGMALRAAAGAAVGTVTMGPGIGTAIGAAGGAASRAVINLSENQFVTFLNLIRFRAFADYMKAHQEAGPEQLEMAAAVLNYATGRGELGRLQTFAEGLAVLAFAARLSASRFQLPYQIIKPLRKKKRTPENIAAAKYAASIMAHFVGFNLLLLILLDIAFEDEVDVGWDPRDSSFGVIKAGRMRINIWGGYSQVARLASRVILSGTDGAGVTEVPDHRREIEPIKEILQYAGSRQAPWIGMAQSLLTRKDWRGDPITFPQMLAEGTTPISVMSTVETAGLSGSASTGAAAGVLDGFGLSTYYGDYATDDNQIEKVLDRGQVIPRSPGQGQFGLPDDLAHEEKEEIKRLHRAALAESIRSNRTALDRLPRETLQPRLRDLDGKARRAAAAEWKRKNRAR